MKTVHVVFAGMCCIGLAAAPKALNAGDAEAAKAKVPLCVGCHGAQGEGKPPAGDLPPYPALAGQIEAYLVKAINAYKKDERNDPVMSAIAKALSDEDIANLATYFSTLER